jgi:hypothetical protein
MQDVAPEPAPAHMELQVIRPGEIVLQDLRILRPDPTGCERAEVRERSRGDPGKEAPAFLQVSRTRAERLTLSPLTSSHQLPCS